MHIARQKRARVGIDMSPLIDCVFQLLIFFLLSSTFLTPMMRLSLPRAGTTDKPEEPDVVMVVVDKDGNYFINTQPVPEAELKPRIESNLASSTSKVVTFQGDAKMQYECFVKVLDAARAAGARHIHISHQGNEK